MKYILNKKEYRRLKNKKKNCKIHKDMIQLIKSSFIQVEANPRIIGEHIMKIHISTREIPEDILTLINIERDKENAY